MAHPILLDMWAFFRWRHEKEKKTQGTPQSIFDSLVRRGLAWSARSGMSVAGFRVIGFRVLGLGCVSGIAGSHQWFPASPAQQSAYNGLGRQ